MLTSTRGRIDIPDLDDRTWQDLVDQMRDLIPKYAPQWTDRNPSDLGMTLIELFAWLAEGLIYRLNRVPEKNYIAFLNLLGITRDPASPAQAFLTFSASPQATSPVVVPRGTQVQTAGTESQSPVVFETDEAVQILPVNLKAALLLSQEDNQYANVCTALVDPASQGLVISVPAKSKWVQLCLGFDLGTSLTLPWRFKSPVPVTSGTPQAKVDWLYSKASTTLPTGWPVLPGFPLPAADPLAPAANLQHDGDLKLTVPDSAGWVSQAPGKWTDFTPRLPADAVSDGLFWLGIRITNQQSSPFSIRFLPFNGVTVSAHNALSIPTGSPGAGTSPGAPAPPEALGVSTGQPFQTFALKHRPLFKRPGSNTPYGDLMVQVQAPASPASTASPSPAATETWALQDDLPAGPGNCYRLNPVTGEITFGDYDSATEEGKRGHGSILPAGSTITATYRYAVGGSAANVGSGMINALRWPVSGIVGVTNLFAATGGADEEPIAETMRRAPESLRTRDRAVTAADYEYLAREANSSVAIVRCLGPRLHGSTDVDKPIPKDAWKAGDPWNFAGIDRSPGNVNVIIVPDQGPEIDYPRLPEELRQGVQQYLDERRSLATRLRVLGPCFLPIIANVTVKVWPEAKTQGLVKDNSAVEQDIKAKLRRFLHPVHGGPDGRGWQVGQSLFVPDVFKAIMPREDIGFIANLEILDDTPDYEPKGRPFKPPGAGPWVPLADYELICYSQSNENSVHAEDWTTG